MEKVQGDDNEASESPLTALAKEPPPRMDSNRG